MQARTLENSSEDALIAGLKAGDDRAYEALVLTYGGRMLAATRRVMRDEEDARDALQEAFIAAFRHLPGFAGESRLGTWLHRIAINAALMRLRSRRARPEEPIEPMLPSFRDDGHAFEPAAEWPEPCDRLVERQEVCALVRRSIDSLPESYRTVLVLRDLEELDTAEVARLLEISENAVKIRLHRARQALRGLLDPELRKGNP